MPTWRTRMLPARTSWPAKPLDPAALTVRVAAVAGAALTFFVSHVLRFAPALMAVILRAVYGWRWPALRRYLFRRLYLKMMIFLPGPARRSRPRP